MLNVVVFFKKLDGRLLRFEEYKDVQSAEVVERCYQIVNKGGIRIKIPLTSIDNIIENEGSDEDDEDENQKTRKR